MNNPKNILEISLYLDTRVRELAFANIFEFFLEIIRNTDRLANDSETSEIIYDTINYGGFFVPGDVPKDRLTLPSLLKIADANYKAEYCKERLAQEWNIHEQTLNKWLKYFDNDLYHALHNKRKLSFLNAYEIFIALGIDSFKTILSRKNLCQICKVSSSDMKRELPNELAQSFNHFIKFPPVFSRNVLDFYDIPYNLIEERDLNP